MNVYKYELEITDEQMVKLPFNAQILTVQMQGNKCCLWALVDPTHELYERTICIHGTGNPIKIKDAREYKYISTFQIPHLGLVFHAFEKKDY
jgi:hypothetical protein